MRNGRLPLTTADTLEPADINAWIAIGRPFASWRTYYAVRNDRRPRRRGQRGRKRRPSHHTHGIDAIVSKTESYDGALLNVGIF